jgi:5-methylcytosine-specific restriction endonuclease McrA
MAGKTFIHVDVDLLKRLYVDQRKTTRQIAEELALGHRTVCRRLRNAGVEMRVQGPERHEKLRDKAWLEHQYVAMKKPAREIAEEIGASSGLVSSWIRAHGIESRPSGNEKGVTFGDDFRRKVSEAKKGKGLGESNPNWRGAKVNPNQRLRTQYATKAWSLAVRERDGHKCVECGAVGRLHAHHIKPWQQHPELRHELSNGKTLCPTCHQKAHGWKFPEWVYHGESRTSAERGVMNHEDIV